MSSNFLQLLPTGSPVSLLRAPDEVMNVPPQTLPAARVIGHPSICWVARGHSASKFNVVDAGAPRELIGAPSILDKYLTN